MAITSWYLGNSMLGHSKQTICRLLSLFDSNFYLPSWFFQLLALLVGQTIIDNFTLMGWDSVTSMLGAFKLIHLLHVRHILFQTQSSSRTFMLELGLIIGFFPAVGWVSSFLLPGPVHGPKKTPVIRPTRGSGEAQTDSERWWGLLLLTLTDFKKAPPQIGVEKGKRAAQNINPRP